MKDISCTKFKDSFGPIYLDLYGWKLNTGMKFALERGMKHEMVSSNIRLVLQYLILLVLLSILISEICYFPEKVSCFDNFETNRPFKNVYCYEDNDKNLRLSKLPKFLKKYTRSTYPQTTIACHIITVIAISSLEIYGSQFYPLTN